MIVKKYAVKRALSFKGGERKMIAAEEATLISVDFRNPEPKVQGGAS